MPGSGSWPELPEPLPVPVVDSHCHLDISYDSERHGPGMPVSDALAHAAAVGVPRVVQVGYDLSSSGWGVEVAHRHPQVVAAVALYWTVRTGHSGSEAVWSSIVQQTGG